MNNSRLAIESVGLLSSESPDNTGSFQVREGELIKIIDAIKTISGSKEWSTLKREVFDGLAGRLSKELFLEARKESPDTNRLSRLSGELRWSEQFSDLTKLEERYRTELTSVRTKLYGKNQE